MKKINSAIMAATTVALAAASVQASSFNVITSFQGGSGGALQTPRLVLFLHQGILLMSTVPSA